MENQEIECSICYDEINEDQLLTLSCGHKYHIKCIYESMKTSCRCPYCRREINNEDKYKIIQADLSFIIIYKAFDSKDIRLKTTIDVRLNSRTSSKEGISEYQKYFIIHSYSMDDDDFEDRVLAYAKKYPKSIFIFPDNDMYMSYLRFGSDDEIRKYRGWLTSTSLSKKNFVYYNTEYLKDSQLIIREILKEDNYSTIYTINSLRHYINKSVDNYIDWSGTGSRGIFSYHGDNGRKRAERLRQLYNSGQITSLHDFFAGNIKDENGRSIPGRINSNPHSYISFFLNEIKNDNIVLKRLGLDRMIFNNVDYNSHVAQRARQIAIGRLKVNNKPLDISKIKFPYLFDI